MSRGDQEERIFCPLFKTSVGRGDHCGICYAEDEEQFKTGLLTAIASCGMAVEAHRRISAADGDRNGKGEPNEA